TCCESARLRKFGAHRDAWSTWSPPSADSPTPPMRNLPIAPIFIADRASLAISREKDGKLRIVHAGWDNPNVVQPDGYRQARGRWSGVFPPPRGTGDPPPKNRGPPS